MSMRIPVARKKNLEKIERSEVLPKRVSSTPDFLAPPRPLFEDLELLCETTELG